MELKKSEYNLTKCINQTYRNRQHIEQYKKIIEDPEKEKRFEAQLCRLCFYNGRCGGAAMTSRPCAICGKTLHSGSTAIEIMCKECAKKMGVCHYCGGDMNDKNRKKL